MLDALIFDNRFVNELPGDPEISARRRQVTGAAYSEIPPTPVRAPRLLAYSAEMVKRLGLSLDEVHTSRFAEVFAGNALLPGMRTYAANYGGHQFGSWAGQLGDGRAINLGEVVNTDGERWELQLKGAGPTPYSRTADGRAVLRSSLREFLCSEAMYHLGVPTTRALSLVTTGEEVVRDMFYDGNPRPEPGAVVCRVSPSFIRFGNFQMFASRGEVELLEKLVDFTISRDFPHIEGELSQRRARWFVEVCERTAMMVVHWLRVGFVHGVMNTDNMSILGLTIDYGPYGFLDNYDPTWTPNTTDASGRRYRYEHQPMIAQWNLVRLAEALSGVIQDTDRLQEGLDRYVQVFNGAYSAMTLAKFGLRGAGTGAQAVIGEAFELMEKAEMDYTLFFRGLGEVPDQLPEQASLTDLLGDVFYDQGKMDAHADRIGAWLVTWHGLVTASGDGFEARRKRMHAVNPRFIPRNYLAQKAIDRAETGDASLLVTLLDVMRHPYDDQPLHAEFAERRPEWARHKAGCSMLSCSS
jgi:serine/tyrosine/threonine adenylyltransferase